MQEVISQAESITCGTYGQVEQYTRRGQWVDGEYYTRGQWVDGNKYVKGQQLDEEQRSVCER